MSRSLRVFFICFLQPYGSGAAAVSIMNFPEFWIANSLRFAVREVGAEVW
jgi:hypothetical protein